MQTSFLKKIGFGAGILIALGLLGYLIYRQFNGGVVLPGSAATSSNKSADMGFGGGLKSTVTDTTVMPTLATPDTAGSLVSGSQVLELLKNISTITLPSQILNSESFNVLTDGTVVLPARVDQGRRNPFATASGTAATSSVSDQSLSSTTPATVSTTPSSTATKSTTSNAKPKTQ